MQFNEATVKQQQPVRPPVCCSFAVVIEDNMMCVCLAMHNSSLYICASEPEVLRMKRALESLASANDEKVAQVSPSLYPAYCNRD